MLFISSSCWFHLLFSRWTMTAIFFQVKRAHSLYFLNTPCVFQGGKKVYDVSICIRPYLIGWTLLSCFYSFLFFAFRVSVCRPCPDAQTDRNRQHIPIDELGNSCVQCKDFAACYCCWLNESTSRRRKRACLLFLTASDSTHLTFLFLRPMSSEFLLRSLIVYDRLTVCLSRVSFLLCL